MIDSKIQQRGRAGGKVIYPNSADTRVAIEPGAPFVDGLVLTRSAGNVKAYTVSGTSVTQGRIDAVSSIDDGLYVLYLMRQEIFLAEGRRMADLGIRMPVALTEIIANRNTTDGEAYTKAVVPSFIPLARGMDAFSYDQVAKTVVIKTDMNKVLVQNKTSPAILPFK